MEKFFKLFKRDLKTERLEMRILEPTPENAKIVWDVLKNENPEDFQFIRFSPKYDTPLPKSSDEVLVIMQNDAKMMGENGVVWYVFHENKLVGYARVHYWDNNKTLQIAAVWLVKSAWGYGFYKEIREAVEKIAIEDLGVHRIGIQCMGGNIRSKSSIEHGGYHLDGCMRDANLMPDGTWMDQLVFTKLASEYGK